MVNNNLDWSKVARALFFEYLESILWRDSFDYLLWIFAPGIVVLLQRSISLFTFLRHPLSRYSIKIKWKCKASQILKNNYLSPVTTSTHFTPKCIEQYYLRGIQCQGKNVKNLKGNYVPWRQFVTILPTWAILLVFVDHSDCETKLGLEYKSLWQSMHLPRCERYLYNQNVLFFFHLHIFYLRIQKNFWSSLRIFFANSANEPFIDYIRA